MCMKIYRNWLDFLLPKFLVKFYVKYYQFIFNAFFGMSESQNKLVGVKLFLQFLVHPNFVLIERKIKVNFFIHLFYGGFLFFKSELNLRYINTTSTNFL